MLRRYAHERGVPVYGCKAPRGAEVRRTELEQGRRGRRRAHQDGRAVRAELRADGRRARSTPRSTASTRASTRRQVEAAFVATQRGTLWGQEGIGGNTIPTAIGLAGIACTRIENACPSGSDAFRVGAMAVASGVHDVVLVIGVEKMRDKSSEEGLLSRAAAGHPIFTRGESAPVLFAPFATRHMHEFGTTRRDARVGRGEEPPQRRPRPLRALPERDHDRRRARRRRRCATRCTCSTAARRPTAPPPCSS